MAHHAKKEVDTSLGYEKNDIKLGGIVITTIALFVVSALAFWLMWLLQVEMERVWSESEKPSPMARESKDKLPPEPRLQGAPGFGVDGPNGRINLELKPPQSEWIELQKIWKAEEKNGQKVIQNGKETFVTLPIEVAKERLIGEGVKTTADEVAKASLTEVNSYVSGASAGRKVTKRK